MSSDIPAKYLGSLLADLKRTDTSGKSVVRECHDSVMDILRRGNYRRAERECLHLLDSDSEDPFTWTLLGLTYLVLGGGDGAIEALDRSSRINNGVALNWTVYGDVMFGIDKVRTAGIHYDMSLFLDPEQVHARTQMLSCCVEIQAHDKALETVLPLVDLIPKDHRVWGDIQACLNRLGDLNKAECVTRELTAKYPRQYRAWYLLASVLIEREEWSKAEKAIRRCLELERNNAPAWTCLGAVLARTGRSKAAERAYRRGTRLDPENFGAWMNLGILLTDRDDVNRAKRAFGRAISLGPEIFESVMSTVREAVEGASNVGGL